MSDKDAVSKDYLSNNRVFADIVNFTLFKGKQVIKPANLRPLDTALLSVLHEKNLENDVALRRIRDLLKEATLMTDGQKAFLMIGIESQSTIDNTMPVRNMLYDAMVYARQVKEITDKNHGRFRKKDLLIPVITLVIYFGDKRWTAPKSLYEMFPTMDKEIRPFVSDYHICVVAPAELSDEDFEKFKTDIGIALKVIHYINDADKLSEIFKHERMNHLDAGASKIIRSVTGIEIKINEKEEKENMKNGFEILIERHTAQGHAAGRTEARMEAIKCMREKLNLTLEQAIEILNIPEEEQKIYLDAC